MNFVRNYELRIMEIDREIDASVYYTQKKHHIYLDSKYILAVLELSTRAHPFYDSTHSTVLDNDGSYASTYWKGYSSDDWLLSYENTCP